MTTVESRSEEPTVACDETPTSNSIEPSARKSRDVRHRVAAALYSQSAPAEMPDLWKCVKPLKALREWLCDPAELPSILQQQFSIAELREVGVFAPRDDEDCEVHEEDRGRLNDKLRDQWSLLAFGRKHNQGSDIHTWRGALSYCEPPALHYACLPAATNTSPAKPLLLAGSDADVQVLRGLQFNATWAAGLENLTGAEAKRLFAAADPGTPPRKFRAVIVAWQFADLIPQPSPLIEAVLERFEKIKKTYGFERGEICDVWRPSSTVLSSLKDAVDFRDCDLVRKICNSSLAACKLPSLEAPEKLPELSFGTAKRELEKLMERPELHSSVAINDAYEQLRSVFQRDVTHKLIADAEACEDPTHKLLILTQATFAELWFERQPASTAARRAAGASGPDDDGLISGVNTKELLTLVEKIISLSKQLACLRKQ